MTTRLSSILRRRLIEIINKNNNVDYTINDISTIRITQYVINIWMNDDNRFDIKHNIMNSIDNR